MSVERLGPSSRWLWGAGVFQQLVEVAFQEAHFPEQFCARVLGQFQQDLGELGQQQQAEALAVVDGAHLQGRSEPLQDSRSGPAVHLGAMAQEQMSLEQRISQQDKQHLAEDQGELAGGHPHDVPETLVLPMALFNRAPQLVGGARLRGTPTGGGGGQYPIVDLSLGVDLAVDDRR